MANLSENRSAQQQSDKAKNHWVYRIVFVLFFILILAQISSEVIPTIAPKHEYLIKHDYIIHDLELVHEYLPIFVLGLMLFLIHRFEETGREAASFLATAGTLVGNLNQLRADVQAMGEQFRTSDVALRGRILFYEGKFEEAVDVFRDVVKNEPRGSVKAELHGWLGRSLYQLNQVSGRRGGSINQTFLKEAIPHLKIAAEHSNDGGLFKLLGDAERMIGSLDRAAGHLQRAIDLDDEGSHDMVAAWSLARVNIRQHPDQEKQLLVKFMAKYPAHTGALNDYVRCLLADNQVDDAIAQCNSSIATRDKNWNLYPIRAQALFARGRIEDVTQALDDLALAKTQNPANYRTYLIEAQYWFDSAFEPSTSLETKNQYLDKAMDACLEGLKHVKNPAPLEAQSALICLGQGKFSEAEVDAKKAVDHSPTVYPNNQLLLAGALLASGRFGPIPNATQKLRAFKPKKGFEIYSYIYELLAAIGMRQKIDECAYLINSLAREIRGFPRFSPVRPEWKLVRSSVHDHIEPFSEREIELSRLLMEYLDRNIDNSILATSLENMGNARDR